MNCRTARSRMFAAADGALSIEERFELDAHVRECARCAERERELSALDAAILRLPAAPVESLDIEAQVRAIHARLEEDAAPRPRRSWWVPLLTAGAAAAAIAIYFLRHPTAPNVAPIAGHDVAPRATTPEDASSGADASVGASTDEGRRGPEVADRAGSFVAPETDPRLAIWDETPAPDVVAIPREPPTVEELAELEGARTDIGRALLAGLRTAGRMDRGALADAFARETRELARAGWPLLPLAEGLVDGGDREVARAAVRFLGLFGNRSDVRALQREVERDDLRADAALALADLGDDAFDAIAALVPRDDVRDLVLDRLAARRDVTNAPFLERLVRRIARVEPRSRMSPSPRESDAEIAARERTLHRSTRALVACGAPATESLLHLGADGVLAREDVLASLRLVPGAARELDRLLRSNVRPQEVGLLVDAIEELHPENGVAWLEQNALPDRKERERALGILACWPAAGGLNALLAARVSGRFDGGGVDAAVRIAFDGDPDSVATLAGERARARDRKGVAALRDALLAIPSPGGVPALVELSASDLGTRDERKSTLLAAMELASPEHADAFVDAYGRLDAKNPAGRELRAICVLALQRLGAPARIAGLFPRSNPKSLARLFRLLDDPTSAARPTTTLYRVAQELDSLAPLAAP